MSLDDIAIFKLMTRRMDWLTQRQTVLSQNVANADTPGYRPNDLEPMAFESEMSRIGAPLRPVATDPMHLAGLSGGGPMREQVDREAYEMAPSGNAVVLEEQMLKVARATIDYQLVTNLYSKHVGLLKTAIGRGGSS